MSQLTRKGILAVAVPGLLLGAAAIGLFLRKPPEPPRNPEPSSEVSARLKLQGALRDASLLDLIRNARVAARKGDSVTHDAMVTGLRREPQRARTLIKSEMSKSNDSADIAILNRMIEELP
jgi:Flp pilus assembly protein TadD